MEYTTVTASKPGTAAPKIEKRTGDIKFFMVDCTPLLNDNELVFGNVKSDEPAGLIVQQARAVQGKYIRFKLSGGPTVAPFTDYKINFQVSTSAQNSYSVPVLVRAFLE